MELFYAIGAFSAWTITVFAVIRLIELLVVERTTKCDYWSAARWNQNWYIVLAVVSFFMGLVCMFTHFILVS